MARSAVKVEINDPYEITPTMWDLFTPTPTSAITPPQFLARTYQAGDWRKYQIDRKAYNTTVSVGKISSICFVHMADREATEMVIRSPGLEHYCLSLVERGQGLLHQPNRNEPTELTAGEGAIFRGRPRTTLRTDGGSSKINVWIPAWLVHRQAAVLLEDHNIERMEFDAIIHDSGGVGASLRRLTEALFTELTHSDSLLSTEIGAAPAQELFLQAIVMAAVRHHSNGLRCPNKPAAPGTVKRAEEYIRSKADEVLTVENIAAAAGCSVRALQVAFRRFRGTSPMEALRRIRLEQAYQIIMGSDGSLSVSEVAAKYGFTNAGRFANLYRRTFGEYPSESLRDGNSRGMNGRGKHPF